MKSTLRIFTLTALVLAFSFQTAYSQQPKNKKSKFVYIQDQNLYTPDGKPFLMLGINLGNWLNPEGYMFLFQDVNSYRLIDQALKELVGPDAVNQFWRQFQDNYITKADIQYLKKTGMNSIRVPFHYKLFTYEDFMGSNDPNRGFVLLDRVIKWCKEEGLYVILDMHAAPGGNTGDNIDDSYGYPWLMENDNNQREFNDIWARIAKRYAKEPIVIGYDLLNEPIATYFDNKEELNKNLERVYINATKAIRKYDKNHIVLFGGAQWNGNFSMFTDWKFDDKMMYTCHIYWCDTLQQNIQHFVDFRNKVNRPIYMGETGENTDEWIGGFRKLLERNNIGWHFWPYKKMKRTSCITAFPEPENWDLIVEYTKKDRSNFKKIRENRPPQEEVQKILNDLLEKVKFENCIKNEGYITALGLKP